MRSLLCAAAALATLAGCDAPPLASMVALSRVDWTTTDASALRVAVSVPPEIQLLRREVALTGTLKGPGDAAPELYEFVLTEVDETGPGLDRATGTPRVFALASAQSRRDFEAFRRAVAAAEAFEAETGQDTSGSLSVEPDLCRASGGIPDEVFVTVFIKSAELSRFVPLTKPSDMIAEARREGSSAAEIEALLPPCT